MAYSKNRRLAEIVSDTSGNLSVEGIVVPTQSSSDNDTSAASTAFVHAHIDAVLDSAPGTLNTLNEIAAALNDDANFNTTVTNSIAAKLPLAGGTMTGNIAHAGNFTLDVGGNLTLDSDGNHIIFADAGTEFGRFSNESSNLVLYSLVNDKDITLKGITGGSSFSALTLDMSAAGAATFNSTINGLTLAAGGISGPATQNFALNTPHSLRINIDSDNNATDQDFIIGNNQTAVNQSNVLFKVQENGNVGIGTSSPSEKLEVNGKIRLGGMRLASNDSGRIGLNRNPDDGSAVTSGLQRFQINGPYSGGDYLDFQSYNSSGAHTGSFYLSGGNIGIRQNNPVEIIDARGGDCVLKLDSTSNGSGVSWVKFADQGTVKWGIGLSKNSGNSGADFTFYEDASSGSPAFTIKDGGNVGIGTTAPSTELHVYGANNSAGDLYTAVGPGNIPSITIQNAGTTDNNNAAIFFRDDQDMRGSIHMRFTGHSTHASELRFATTTANNTREKFVMTAAGQLGINKLSGFGTGGFGTPMLVIKQSVNSAWGGINVEANGNDSIFSISCLDSGATLNTSYRTSAGHKPLTMQCAGQDGIQIGTGGNVRIGSGNVASNGATHQLHVDSGTIGYGLKVHSSSGYGLQGANNASYFHHSTDRAMNYWDSPGYFSGGAHTYSDSRLKENVATITGALDSVAKMNGVTFTWINGDKRRGPDGKQFGVLAQNMLEVDSALPTLNVDPLETQDNIDDDSKDTDYYSMDYARLTPYFIEAIKELKTKLEAAEARIATLEG